MYTYNIDWSWATRKRRSSWKERHKGESRRLLKSIWLRAAHQQRPRKFGEREKSPANDAGMSIYITLPPMLLLLLPLYNKHPRDALKWAGFVVYTYKGIGGNGHVRWCDTCSTDRVTFHLACRRLRHVSFRLAEDALPPATEALLFDDSKSWQTSLYIYMTFRFRGEQSLYIPTTFRYPDAVEVLFSFLVTLNSSS